MTWRRCGPAIFWRRRSRYPRRRQRAAAISFPINTRHIALAGEALHIPLIGIQSLHVPLTGAYALHQPLTGTRSLHVPLRAVVGEDLGSQSTS